MNRLIAVLINSSPFVRGRLGGGRSRAFRSLATTLILALVSTAFSPAITGCSGGPATTDENLSAGAKSTVYYIDDHLGSAQLMTDGDGNVVYEGFTAPYGIDLDGADVVEETGEGADYSYTTRERDDETGLIYFGKRYYAPEMGRWITPDALFLEDPSLIQDSPLENSLYSYVKNNPIGNMDMGGEFACGGLCMGALFVGAVLMLPSDSPNPNANTHSDQTGVQIGTAITPILNDIRDAAELATGRDFVTGADIGLPGRVMAAFGLVIGSGAAYRGMRNIDGAIDVEKSFYHYTSGEAADSIARQGLKPGRDGFSYATTKGGLSPIQAQIELALPANRPLPGAVLKIDAEGISRAGINPVFGPRRVQGNLSGFGAGGGTEVLFDQNIPAQFIQRVQ